MPFVPLKAHILAIDPAKRSGAALFREGVFERAEEVDVEGTGVEGWIKSSLLSAIAMGRTFVLVGETWGRGGARGMQQWQGLGAAWKRWEWALKDEWKRQRAQGIYQPAPKVHRVHTSTWRSSVFGGRMTSEMAKDLSVTMANRWYGCDFSKTQHNAAEAVMIGRWASYAPEIEKLIPKKFR